MVYFIVSLFIVLLLIWLLEARAYLYLFELCAYKIIRSPCFIDDMESYFPNHQKVLASINQIKEELTDFLNSELEAPKAHEVDEYNAPISAQTGPAWKTFYLKVYNGWFMQNTRLFPKTFTILKNMEEVTCVMFSIMEAGNCIPPHEGKMRGILRYQLPLIISKNGNCTITVGGEKRVYNVDSPLMFDDNNMHTVQNNTDSYRAILFLDIQKPSNGFIRHLDNFFMKLVQLSPKFRKANVAAHNK